MCSDIWFWKGNTALNKLKIPMEIKGTQVMTENNITQVLKYITQPEL